MKYRVLTRTLSAFIISCNFKSFPFSLSNIILCRSLNKNCLNLLSLVILYNFLKDDLPGDKRIKEKLFPSFHTRGHIDTVLIKKFVIMFASHFD